MIVFKHVLVTARPGIDLETPYHKRDVSEDLDHIILDAMTEAFDTGVSC